MSPCCLHGGLAAVTDSLVGTSALLHAQVVQTSRHPMHPFLPRLQTRSISCLGMAMVEMQELGYPLPLTAPCCAACICPR